MRVIEWIFTLDIYFVITEYKYICIQTQIHIHKFNFIYSTDIYYVPTTCPMLNQGLSTHRQRAQTARKGCNSEWVNVLLKSSAKVTGINGKPCVWGDRQIPKEEIYGLPRVKWDELIFRFLPIW